MTIWVLNLDCRAPWQVPLAPATREAQVEGELDLRSHTSLGNTV